MVNKFKQLKSYHFSKDILENKDWYEKSFPGILFTIYIVSYGNLQLINKRIKDTFRISLIFAKGDRFSWLWDGRDIKRIRARVLRLTLKKPKILNDYFKDWKKDWAKFKKTVVRLEKLTLSNLNDDLLYNEYLRLRNNYARANSLPYLVDSFLTSGENDWLVELITKELGGKVKDKKILDCLAKLTAPTTDSFSSQESIDLLVIADKFQNDKNRDKLNKNLKAHAQKYYWIENNYYPTEPLNEKYFLNKILEIKRQGQIREKLIAAKNRAAENKKIKDKLIKSLKISKDLQKIIRVAERFTNWQDTRKSGVLITNHFIFNFLKEIARRAGLNPWEIYYATDQELFDIIFRKKFNRLKLQQRRSQGVVLVNTPRGIFLIEGREARKYPKELFLRDNINIQEIKGTAASPGMVKGRVRIIRNLIDFKLFQPGEILVTNNTTPEFVPIMKKAQAIITEQGGITCHAAIISRELNIPCIIGAKIATKVLKNGDIVEVDANRGWIRKLPLKNN